MLKRFGGPNVPGKKPSVATFCILFYQSNSYKFVQFQLCYLNYVLGKCCEAIPQEIFRRNSGIFPHMALGNQGNIPMKMMQERIPPLASGWYVLYHAAYAKGLWNENLNPPFSQILLNWEKVQIKVNRANNVFPFSNKLTNCLKKF